MFAITSSTRWEMGAVEPTQGHELLVAPVAAPVVDPTTTAAPTVIPATAMAAARGSRRARSLPRRENTPCTARSPYLDVAANATRKRVDNYALIIRVAAGGVNRWKQCCW